MEKKWKIIVYFFVKEKMSEVFSADDN